MDHSPRLRNYAVIPPDELRCVWMTAGMVPYQLCDRAYECAQCPIERAMRNRFTGQLNGDVLTDAALHVNADAPHPPSSFPSEPIAVKRSTMLRDSNDYRYSENHCWLKRLNPQIVRIGIEPGLAAALLIPKSIVLPSVGQHVKKGFPCVWIIMDDGTYPVLSPIEGIVVTRNTLVTDDPSEVVLRPYENGWLYDVRIQSTAEAFDTCPDYLIREAAIQQYTTDAIHFKELLVQGVKSVHHDSSTVGETLADGGAPLLNVSDLLGMRKYCKILRQVFG